MKITDNIAMLELAGPYSAIYPTLAWDENNLVLIDAGFPGQADALVSAIAAEGFRAGDITHIIITHQDIDHIGCLPDILQLAPSAQVIAHAEEAPYIDGRKTPVKLAALEAAYDSLPEAKKQFCATLREGFSSRRAAIGKTVENGTLLPMAGGIEVVHTPGHTPGHIALFLRQGRIMVAGDAANIENGRIIGPNPRHSQDITQGMASLEKLKAYYCQGVVSYHCGFLLLESAA
jgi:glyoxylase-like metal-dependent hydrolase (beta-lactamase superfamily II)